MAKLGDRLTRKLEQVDVELIKFGQDVVTAWSPPTPNLPIYKRKGSKKPSYGILLLRRVGVRAWYYPVRLLLLPKSDFKVNPSSRFPQVHARGTGICQRRRELYSQTFDELIRQVGELNLGKTCRAKFCNCSGPLHISCIVFLVIAKR